VDEEGEQPKQQKLRSSEIKWFCILMKAAMVGWADLEDGSARRQQNNNKTRVIAGTQHLANTCYTSRSAIPLRTR